MDENSSDDNSLIEMNNETGPGWFLKIAYLVIGCTMVFYFFAYRDWKSSYDIYKSKIDQQITQMGK